MLKKVLIILTLGSLQLGYSTLQAYGAKNKEDSAHAPVILDYYAAEVIRPGATWKIYLRAKDNEGDMKYIAAILWQAGVGYYPTQLTYLRKGNKREFEGYLFLRTQPDSDLVFDQIQLTLLIRDDRWNRSELVNIPLSFDFPVPRQQDS